MVRNTSRLLLGVAALRGLLVLGGLVGKITSDCMSSPSGRVGLSPGRREDELPLRLRCLEDESDNVEARDRDDPACELPAAWRPSART